MRQQDRGLAVELPADHEASLPVAAASGEDSRHHQLVKLAPVGVGPSWVGLEVDGKSVAQGADSASLVPASSTHQASCAGGEAASGVGVAFHLGVVPLDQLEGASPP